MFKLLNGSYIIFIISIIPCLVESLSPDRMLSIRGKQDPLQGGVFRYPSASGGFRMDALGDADDIMTAAVLDPSLHSIDRDIPNDDGVEF